jgi:predicted kinase
MKEIKIMRGLPGSGKSTYVREILSDYQVCSADHYFLDSFGKYHFDPSKISEAHAACFRAALKYTQAGERVVIDNTNIRAWEISPYVLLAQSFGYDVEILQVNAEVHTAHARNTHGVPYKAIEAMAAALCAEALPPFWKVTRVQR